jgi:hypothetical protein
MSKTQNILNAILELENRKKKLFEFLERSPIVCCFEKLNKRFCLTKKSDYDKIVEELIDELGFNPLLNFEESLF